MPVRLIPLLKIMSYTTQPIKISWGDGIPGLYWLFAIVYSFMVWGFWWGIFNIFIPISPMIDLVKYIIHK